ncbi:GAF domain-containing protein [Lacticaseibacillus brantae]|uniref:GAF domain-containing protein n=1 Tax=Lacticaseibacillus brantae DSM 23927 TaxID=1423727 RepID=A0A0R2B930_9LACO|nr:GAF domain-containing protein [Lacticaseibacillus brantae]KRM72905.1 GAF domain-containing protein [Lacticaseibacillus brantae DSM 23927]
MEHLSSIIVDQIDALLQDEHNSVTNLSNAAALINDTFDQINWAGFYLFNGSTNELDLGPFQGKVACMHIQPGSGVVGTSYQQNKPIIVPDVHAFAGHIACDAASNSEIVVPVTVDGQTVAILDIDSPALDRFNDEDRAILVDFTAQLAKHLDVKALTTLY